VPIDDETTMVYNWIYTGKSMPLSDEDRLERASATETGLATPSARAKPISTAS
jgi:hypothetical protein